MKVNIFLLLFLFAFLVSIAQEPQYEFKCKNNYEYTISFMPDGQQIAIGGRSDKLRIENIPPNTDPITLTAATWQIRNLAVHKNGHYIAIGEPFTFIRLISTESNSIIKKIPNNKEVVSFDFHPEKEILCYLNGESIMKTGFTKSSEESLLYSRKKGETPYFGCKFSPNGDIIAAYGKDANIDFVSYPEGQLIWTFESNGKPVEDCCFSPDGKQLAIGIESKIFLINFTDHTLTKTLSQHTSIVSCIKYHPNNNFLISRSMDQGIIIWSLKEGKSIDSIQVGNAMSHIFDLSPDGNTMAALSGNNNIRIYDLKGMLEKFKTKLIQESKQAYFAKKWDRSLNLFNTLENYQSLNDTLSFMKGRVFFELANYISASNCFAASRKLNPTYKQCLEWQQRAFEARLMKKEAFDVVLDLYRLDPGDIQVKCTLIEYMYKEEKYEDIKKQFSKTDTLSIFDKDCFLTIAISYEKTADYIGAIKLFKRFINKYPENTEARIHLANCYIQTRDFSESYKLLEPILLKDASNEQALWLMALTYFYKGDLVKVNTITDKYIKQYPDKDWGFELSGISSQIRRNYMDAADQFQKVSQRNPQDGYSAFQTYFSLVLADKVSFSMEYLLKTLQTPLYKEPEFLNLSVCSDTIKGYLKIMMEFHRKLRDSLLSQSLDIKPIGTFETQSDFKNRQSKNEEIAKGIFNYHLSRFNRRINNLIESYSSKVDKVKIDELLTYESTTGRLPVIIQNKKFWIKASPSEAKKIIDNSKEIDVQAERKLRVDFQGYELGNIVIIMPITKSKYPAEPEVVINTNTIAVNTVSPAANTRGMEAVYSPKPIPNVAFDNYLFVIGIDNYKYWSPLDNAVNDAREFANILTNRYQFTKEKTSLLLNEDASWSNIDSVFTQLVKRIRENDRLVIFYAGHGDFDSLKNKGYIIPCDAKKNVKKDYYSYDEILNAINQITSKHTVLIADACFSGAIFEKKRGGSNISYDQIEQYKSRYGITSGRLESVDDSYRNTKHSPFSYFLLEYLTNNTKESLTITDVFENLRINLLEANQKPPIGGPLKDSDDRNGAFIFHQKQ